MYNTGDKRQCQSRLVDSDDLITFLMSDAQPGASSGATNDQISSDFPLPDRIRMRSPLRSTEVSFRVRGVISTPTFSFLWIRSDDDVTTIDARLSSLRSSLPPGSRVHRKIRSSARRLTPSLWNRRSWSAERRAVDLSHALIDTRAAALTAATHNGRSKKRLIAGNYSGVSLLAGLGTSPDRMVTAFRASNHSIHLCAMRLTVSALVASREHDSGRTIQYNSGWREPVPCGTLSNGALAPAWTHEITC